VLGGEGRRGKKRGGEGRQGKWTGGKRREGKEGRGRRDVSRMDARDECERVEATVQRVPIAQGRTGQGRVRRGRDSGSDMCAGCG
jgi:hypothetical protein